MSSNIFQFGRLGVEKARIISIDNRLRKRYHDRIIQLTVPIIETTPTEEQIALGLQSVSALIPDQTVSSNMIPDKSLTGSTIGLTALDGTTLLHNPSLNSLIPPPSNYVSNLEYAKKEIAQAILQLDVSNAFLNLGNIFEGKLDYAEATIPIIDASIQLIDTIFWATTSRFADQSITQTQLTTNPILSTTATIQLSSSPAAKCPVNTQYSQTSIVDTLIGGNTTFTIGDIANAVSDLSYQQIVSQLPLLEENSTFNSSNTAISITQQKNDLSLVIIGEYPFETTNETIANIADASLNIIQTAFSQLDASFTGIISNAITTFDTAISSIYSTDTSFSLFERKWDNSYNEFAAPNWVQGSSLIEDIVLPITATATTLLFDNSSNSLATTEFVKMVLAGSLSNDPDLLDALEWIRNAIANDASFAYKTMQEIGELNTNVSLESDRIDQIENNDLPLKIDSLREIRSHRIFSDNSLTSLVIPVFDASLEYLERQNPFLNTNYNLTSINWTQKDISLNNVITKWDASYQHTDNRYQRSDASASLFSTDLDQSITLLTDKISSIDTSANYTAGLVSISQVGFDIFKYAVDSSIGSITALCDSMDASNAAVVAGIQTINNSGSSVDASMADTYLYIKESSITRDASLILIDTDERYGLLDLSMSAIFQYADAMRQTTKQNIATNMAYKTILDISLNVAENSTKSRETTFINLPIDASISAMEMGYRNRADHYVLTDGSINRQLDLSINQIEQAMATFNIPLLNQLAATMDAIDNRPYGTLREKCFNADASLAIYLDNLSPLIPLDNETNRLVSKTGQQDASISLIETSGFIATENVSSVLELPEEVEIGQPTTNLSVGNTQYYWDYLREKIQGNSNFTIDQFSEYIGDIHIGNFVNQNTTQLLADLSGLNQRLDGISNVNLQEFNVDASLAYLQSLYTSKEDDIRQLETFYVWKTATDASVSDLERHFRIMEVSLNFTLNFFNTSVPQKTRLYNSIDTSYNIIKRSFAQQYWPQDEWTTMKKSEINDSYIIVEDVMGTVGDFVQNIENTTAIIYSNGATITSTFNNLDQNVISRYGAVENRLDTGDMSLNIVSGEIPTYLETRLPTVADATFTERVEAIDISLNLLEPLIGPVENYFNDAYAVYDTSFAYLETVFENANTNLGEDQFIFIEDLLLLTQTIETDISNIETYIFDSSSLSTNLALPSGTTVISQELFGESPATTLYYHQEIAPILGSSAALDTLNEFALALGEDPSLNTTITERIGSIDFSLNEFETAKDMPIGELDASMVIYSGYMGEWDSSYNLLKTATVNTKTRMGTKEDTLNSLTTQYGGFNSSVVIGTQMMVSSDTSVNLVDGIFNLVEPAMETIDASLTVLQIYPVETPVFRYTFDTGTNSGNFIKNETTGLYDASINQGTITTGSQALGSAALAVSTTGTSDDYAVWIPDINFANYPTFSISLWFRLRAVPINFPWLYSFRLNNTNAYSPIYFASRINSNSGSGNQLITHYTNGTNTSTPDIVVALNLQQWYHFVVVYNSGTIKTYMNGNILATQTMSLTNTGGSLCTTNWLTSTNDGTSGLDYIDDYRFYDRILSLNDIYAIYNEPGQKITDKTGTIETKSGTIEDGILVNDASTNILATRANVADASLNPIFDIITKPTGVNAISTNTTMTVAYQAPILGDAVGIIKYSIVGTPISGTSTPFSADVSAGILSRQFTGLGQNQVYNVAVSAYTDYGISTTAGYTYGTTLDAPTGLSGTGRTTSSISLTSNQVLLPFSFYNISYGLASGGVIQTATSATRNATITGLLSGRIYDISVNIQNTYGPSPWASTRDSTSLVLSTLSVGTITNTSIDVSFSPALATQDCSYVLRTDPDATQYVLVAGATSQSLTGLVGGTNYTIYLDASNLYTNERTSISARTLINPATGLTASSTTTSTITVTYSIGSTTGFVNTTITATSGANTFTATGNSTTGTVSGLARGTQYTVSVVINTNNGSSSSVGITATTQTVSVNDLTATSTPGYVGITTSPPYNNPTSSYGIFSLNNNTLSFKSTNTLFTSLGSTWTIQMWYKVRQQLPANSAVNIVGRYNISNALSSVYYHVSNRFGRNIAASALEFGDVISLDTWSHVTCRFSDGTWTTYINAVQKDIRGGSGTNLDGYSFALPTTLKADAVNSGVIVQIAEFRVWNIALSGTQISANWNIEVAGNETGLIGLFRFRSGAIFNNDMV